MRRLEYSDLVEGDLGEAWHFTFERWGAEAAVQFVTFVERQLEQLAAEPELGKELDDRPGIYAFTIQKHSKDDGRRVYFVFDEEKVLVVRILHMKMDPDRHL